MTTNLKQIASFKVLFTLVILLTSALAVAQVQPFLWTDAVREGRSFSDERIPYEFIAPADLVYKIWKEGSFFRFEARSYLNDDIQIAITSMRNLKKRQPDFELQSLQSELETGCLKDTVQTNETAFSIQVTCKDTKHFFLDRRLEAVSLSSQQDQILQPADRIDFFEMRTKKKNLVGLNLTRKENLR